MTENSTTLKPLRAVVVPAVITCILGYQALSILPLTTGALIETLGLDSQVAGLLGSAELLGMALGAALFAIGLSRVAPRWLAIGSGLWLAVWQAASMADMGVSMLLLCRASTGLGAGIFVGLLARIIAQVAEPERLTGFIIILIALYGGGLLLLVPLVLGLYGVQGIYGLLALITAALAGLFFSVPGFDLPVKFGQPDESESPVRLSLNRFSAEDALLLFFAVGFSAASSALWAFTERLGLRHGFDMQQTGYILAMGTVMGVLGAFAATSLARLASHNLTIIKVCAITIAVAGFVMAQTDVFLIFICGFFIFRFVQNFNDPFIVGAIARHDKIGRLLSVNAAGGLIGVAFGPALGGWLMSLSPNFQALAAFYVTLTAVAFISLLRFLAKTSPGKIV